MTLTQAERPLYRVEFPRRDSDPIHPAHEALEWLRSSTSISGDITIDVVGKRDVWEVTIRRKN